jgi:hypothetical protein
MTRVFFFRNKKAIQKGGTLVFVVMVMAVSFGGNTAVASGSGVPA